MRVEKKLNKLDGVTATVNYATEQATVEAPVDVDVQTLIDTVEETGYSAIGARGDGDEARPRWPARCRLDVRRLKVSAALAVPVVLLSMIPALQFDCWQWLALALATPVVVWGA